MAEIMLLGTHNRGKAVELVQLLNGLPWEIKTLDDYPTVPEPVEDGETFEDNAIKKVDYFCSRFNVCCVADDSGLVVDALGGAPGVYSARYSGPGATDQTNNHKLLSALEGVEDSRRTARFVCCIAYKLPGHTPHIERGTIEGHIARSVRGPHGFGYDPLFIPEDHLCTFGEMPPERKLTMSHRGRALANLRAFLEART